MFDFSNILNFRKSELVQNSAKLISANVIAQIIGIVVYPLLTRLYSPDDFGLLNLFLSIGGVLIILANAELQYSIIIPKSETTAVACFHNGLSMMVGVTLFCILITPFSTQIANLFNTPQLADWLYFIPAFVFISSFWVLLNYWYIRNKQFGKISTYQIVQCATSVCTKCGFGFIGFTASGMIVSSIIAPLFSILINIKTSFKKILTPLLNINKHECAFAAKEYINFPKYDLPRALINNLSSNLPFFLLTPYFSLAEMGFLGMAFTLALRPINMIVSSVNHVLFQKVAELVQNRQKVNPLIKQFIKYCLLIIIPSFCVLYFFLPYLTKLFLGDGWETTGQYIRLMLPWLGIVCICSSLNFIPDVFKKQRGLLCFEIIYLIIRVISLSAGILFDNFLLCIILFSISSALTILIECFWFVKIVKNYDLQLVK